jgi:hypothetical protein
MEVQQVDINAFQELAHAIVAGKQVSECFDLRNLLAQKLVRVEKKVKCLGTGASDLAHINRRRQLGLSAACNKMKRLAGSSSYKKKELDRPLKSDVKLA